MPTTRQYSVRSEANEGRRSKPKSGGKVTALKARDKRGPRRESEQKKWGVVLVFSGVGKLGGAFSITLRLKGQQRGKEKIRQEKKQLRMRQNIGKDRICLRH